MEQILLAIQKIKIDAAYGKKKHFNAADRKEKKFHIINVTLIVINVIAVSAFFYVVINTGEKLATTIALFINFFAVVLSWLQTYLNYQKVIQGHRRIGNKYLSAMKKSVRLQAYLASNIMEDKDIRITVDDLGDQVDQINQEAEEYPTNGADYEIARDGINNAEEEYTKKELMM
jgi:ABC-type multidrug transport system fused ATPase/permease subunit